MVTTRSEGEDDVEDAAPAVALGSASSTDGNFGPTFPAEPPFGPDFFDTQLSDCVRGRCGDDAENVAVVELRLADGTTLDVCRIPTIDRLWMAVEVFRDAEAREDTDLVFIPYETVTRVTISERLQRERPLGFRFGG